MRSGDAWVIVDAPGWQSCGVKVAARSSTSLSGRALRSSTSWVKCWTTAWSWRGLLTFTLARICWLWDLAMGFLRRIKSSWTLACMIQILISQPIFPSPSTRTCLVARKWSMRKCRVWRALGGTLRRKSPKNSGEMNLAFIIEGEIVPRHMWHKSLLEPVIPNEEVQEMPQYTKSKPGGKISGTPSMSSRHMPMPMKAASKPKARPKATPEVTAKEGFQEV